MEDYTLRISESDSKALALINYLKTLDFIELTRTTDWWDEMTSENQASIQRGLDDLENGRVHSDEDIRESVRQRILNTKKG